MAVFYNGKMLFVDGKFANDPRCCGQKPGGCQCPSNLKDEYRVRMPCVGCVGSAGMDGLKDVNTGDWAIEWYVTVKRPIPAYDEDGRRIYPPNHVGNCCWYAYGTGENLLWELWDANWKPTGEWVPVEGTCGHVFLYLDPADCRWKLTGFAWGTRDRNASGGETPVGTYSEYVLDWNQNVIVEEVPE